MPGAALGCAELADLGAWRRHWSTRVDHAEWQGDLKLFEPITICSVVTLCDREERYPVVVPGSRSMMWPAVYKKACHE